LTVLQYALALDFGVDWLFPGLGGNPGAATFPGRMSPHTALSFCLSGAALF
jgi:hypothetical protein